MPKPFKPSAERLAELQQALGGRIVRGHGVTPNPVMFIGEAPGETEARKRQPFVGKSGKEQARYLTRHGYDVRDAYLTNLIKEYTAGNPDPTPAQIAVWGKQLLDEIRRVRPRTIITVGKFSTQYLLGDVALAAVHGLPQRSDLLASIGVSAVVMPCYHPAHGFYEEEAQTRIDWDYRQAVGAIRREIPLDPIADDLAGSESYRDLTGRQLADALSSLPLTPIGLDTEGYLASPWSVQVSWEPGQGVVLRCGQPDFAVGIAALQRYIDRGSVTAIHNGMHDIAVCRACGLELFNANLWDTMYAAYITIEPQGLKPLAYRWTGMKMNEYDDTVGPAGIDKQLEYLTSALDGTWERPEPRIEYENDGTSRVYTPQPVERRIEAILCDFYVKGINPQARWRKVDRVLRDQVEAVLGPFPIGTLADIPLADAVRYAARDPDATLRTYHKLQPELERRGLAQLHADGMSVLPVFEEMQSSGIPASRARFESLSMAMWEEMCRIQARISFLYYGGQPFNPASPDKVAALMRRQKLTGEKRTSTNKMSTSKKSIEHLRHTNDAMRDVIDWREHQKIRDSFCRPVIELFPPGVDYMPVRCTIKTTRVATRRISASEPNLTAIPVRNELGQRVRDCYEAVDGEVFGSWDLSQIEMRYMAHISRDPLLVEFFNDPRRDVHCETAARIFGLKIHEDGQTKQERYCEIKELEHRYPSKRAGFGIITNITGSGLLDQLRMFGCKGWDDKACDKLIKEWLNIYKGVRTFLDDCVAEVKEHGVVHDCWGMPRYLPGVWSNDRVMKGEAERAASSHKIQGGAQGMIQRSMAWLKPQIRALRDDGCNVRWMLQIHDELLLRFDQSLWDTVDPLVREALTEHSLALIVPVACSGNMAKSWGKLK